ncbi:MAG: TetR/AcrR family transcriptional regulator [Synergistota bacterium]|nr:TetR/AcrR family transcriptional regulator [Synergistota bacterium]
MASNLSDTKEQIMTVARHFFARYGYHGTSVDSIVKEANLSKGALYWHFKTKMDLYRAVLEAEVDKIKAFFAPTEEDMCCKPIDYLINKGGEFFGCIAMDEEGIMLWMNLWMEARRGNEQISKMARELSESLMQDMIDMVKMAFPAASSGAGRLSPKELALTLSSCFEGISKNVGLRCDVDQAKRSWRFVVERLIKGGHSYAA